MNKKSLLSILSVLVLFASVGVSGAYANTEKEVVPIKDVPCVEKQVLPDCNCDCPHHRHFHKKMHPKKGCPVNVEKNWKYSPEEMQAKKLEFEKRLNLTEEQKAQARENIGIVDLIYPVGSIYMSINSVSPETLFGGTWEQIKDTFLLSAGDTYEGGTSGGNTEHTHEASGYALITASGAAGLAVQTVGSIEAWQTDYLYTTSSRAESVQSRSAGTATKTTIENASNMPPYLTVYMWKRTA